MWTPSAPTVGVPPNPSRLLALGSRNSTPRFPRFATSATDPGLFRRELMSSSACSVATKSSAATRLAATRLAAISSLFQRGNPSLSSSKHRFQASIFHLRAVRRLQAKRESASSEHVRTYPRSIIRAKSLPTTGSYTRRRSHVRLPRNFPAGPSEASSLGNPDAGERFGKIFDDRKAPRCGY